MITATPSANTTAYLEGAPSGLTLTARIMNGGVLVQSIANPAITYDDGYAASFTAPVTTGTMTFEWLDGPTIVGSEMLVVTAAPVVTGTESGTLQRVLRATVVDLVVQFTDAEGTPVDPSPATATVVVTRDIGTTLASGSATRTGVGAFKYALTADDTALLDILTVTWTSSLGSLVTTCEVVGGFLFTVAQARTLSPLSNTTAYPTAAIIDARTMVETALEEACGVAFVPRYTRERLAGSGRSTMLLRPRLRAVRSVSIDDSAVVQSYLDTIRVLPTGEAYYPSYWTHGYANIEIAYEHGYSTPPARVSQAALLWVKNFLVKGPIDERTTSMQSEDGTFTLATPGIRGSYTGLPEVDAVIQQYSLEAGVL